MKKILNKFEPSNVNKTMKKLGWFFIHIPKCGGSNFFIKNFGINYGHKGIQYYQKALGSAFNNYSFYTIVRDPAERFESAFNFLKNGGISKEDKIFNEKYLKHVKDINEFIPLIVNKKIPTFIHFQTQTSFVSDSKSNKLCAIAFKIENLQLEIDQRKHILEESFIKCVANMLNGKKINSGKKSSHKITTENLKLLKNFYNDDYQNFGYEY